MTSDAEYFEEVAKTLREALTSEDAEAISDAIKEVFSALSKVRVAENERDKIIEQLIQEVDALRRQSSPGGEGSTTIV